MGDKHFFSHNYLKSVVPVYVDKIEVGVNNTFIYTSSKKINILSKFFKNHTVFSLRSLQDIFAVDNIQSQKRFVLYYCFLSLAYNFRLIAKLHVPQDSAIPSLTNEYSSAGWLEREVWDLFGIFFYGHQDLRRILTDYGFSGFPLRKDFPLSGYLEVRYDDELKRVVSEPLEISQEFRFFEFRSPWEKN